MAIASAQVFANVLRAAFAGAGDASDFLLPATDLSALFPDPAARFVEAHSGIVRTAAHAQVVRASRNEVTLAVGGNARVDEDAVHHQQRLRNRPLLLVGRRRRVVLERLIDHVP